MVSFDTLKFLVVGAGFYGATMAERIASVRKQDVLVVDKRPYVGGNSYSMRDPATGIEIHLHGSHIFHTGNLRVWEYVRSFGEFNAYRHHVFALHNGRVYPMPIGLSTVNQFFEQTMHPKDAKIFLEAQRGECPDEATNLEDKAVSLIGRPLYEAFVKGYTEKHWGDRATNLPPEIISRLPVRTTYNSEYFTDPFQGIPRDGYGALISRMLDHPRITVKTGVDYLSIRHLVPQTCTVIYTGMLDELFNYEFGRLEWRSLDFAYETLAEQDFQGTSVMNYVDATVPYTRIHEFKHYTPEKTAVFNSPQTVVCREYPKAFKQGDEAYYPVETARNRNMRDLYIREAQKLENVRLGGRLGTYRYLNMDTVIENALADFAILTG